VNFHWLRIFWWQFSLLNGTLSTTLPHGYSRVVFKMPGSGLGSWRNCGIFLVTWTHSLKPSQCRSLFPSRRAVGAWSFFRTSV
jgi:hypothetical protein